MEMDETDDIFEEAQNLGEGTDDVFGEEETKTKTPKRRVDPDDSKKTSKLDLGAKKTKKTDIDAKITNFNNKKQQKEKGQSMTGIISESTYIGYPMFISFMQGIGFFQKIMENLESTFPEVNLVFDEKGISVFAIDNANIAFVSITITKDSGCFDIYHCKRKFTLKVITKVFASKFKKPENYSSVCFVFANEKDLNTLHIIMIDVTTGLIDDTELNGDSTPFEDKEDISTQKITIPQPIEFNTKYLAQVIFDKFKDVSKVVLIGCDYNNLHFGSGGEPKNHMGPAKKKIILPLKKMKRKETDASGKLGEYVFVPEEQGDGGISSGQVKQLNEMLSGIIQKSANYESAENMKKILEHQNSKSEPPCAEYILDYITSILKINDLSSKVTIGFNRDGVMMFRFLLSIGEMTYAVGSIMEPS